MPTIHKQTLLSQTEQLISLPAGSVVLTAQTQNEVICLWYLHDGMPRNPNTDEVRKVRIFGTGHVIPGRPGTYKGTVQLAGGKLVFHVFVDGL
jgi:hypothetical protein